MLFRSITKIWKGRPKQQADFGLFKKVGNNLIPVPNMNETIDTANPEKWIVKYVNLPYTEANGDLINYVIKEVYYSDILENGEIVDLYGGKYKVSYDNEGNITNTELITGHFKVIIYILKVFLGGIVDEVFCRG